MRNKQEEPFVRSRTINKKCKKTPLSNDLLNINVPTLLTVKKDPSPPETKLPQKQGQKQSQVSDALSSCHSSYLYEQKATHTLAVLDISNDDRSKDATTGDGAEFQYISRIIKCTGIDRNAPVSGTRWYSSSHPLDPSIFHLLELLCRSTTVSQLSHRCNRKLLFQLVDEILVELLKPYLNLKPWLNSISDDYQIMNGSQLIDKLFAKIQSFPSADCRVLEDIDALIDIDLCKHQQPLQRSTAFEEEGEAIVSEIERDIVDSLVKETAMEVFGGA
ncbi:hypothetical protein F0562_031312 [Nyssa sinensis]|uniref:DUF4378 domain-containing protein n=1 Tax=Nyssa sinensis TaxID=561372 RepID=A0A5J5ART2_9ASTE|nr:hypothetical protein F0562_031312 [Nyssa sinensis]